MLTFCQHSAHFVYAIWCSHFNTSRMPKFTLYNLDTSLLDVLLHSPLIDEGTNTVEVLASSVLNEEKAYFISSSLPHSRASSKSSSKLGGNSGVGA